MIFFYMKKEICYLHVSMHVFKNKRPYCYYRNNSLVIRLLSLMILIALECVIQTWIPSIDCLC